MRYLHLDLAGQVAGFFNPGDPVDIFELPFELLGQLSQFRIGQIARHADPNDLNVFGLDFEYVGRVGHFLG